MKFTAYKDKFGIKYWFSGIYKITSYEYYGNPARPMPKGEKCYQCFVPIGKRWGNYVNRSIQSKNEPLSFDDCVKLCSEHSKTNVPSNLDIKNAEIARTNFLN